MANRPIHEIRLGKVKAAIWRNETDSGVRYSVALVRIFRTDNGWESSPSFGRDELPLVAKVADRVHSWIYEQNDRSDSVSDAPEPAAPLPAHLPPFCVSGARALTAPLRFRPVRPAPSAWHEMPGYASPERRRPGRAALSNAPAV